ncbi:MAG TPA: amino acid adenylation domain-containing protein [Thermoanaerobaculia bacterium]|nr:amino acid adenylation domain-containing protein [Thermoanaerobaculia bacterium]
MSKLNVEDIYPLSPGQQGMLMVLLLSGSQSEVYFDQFVMTVEGELDVAAWRRAWQQVVDRHASLRTLFLWESREQPLQVVRRQAELPCEEHDWRTLTEAERQVRLETFLREDRALGFDLGQPPLMRLAVIRLTESVWKVVWSFHHLIVDGWSLSRVFGEAVSFYGALREGRELQIEPPRRYRDYIAWVQRQDLGRAEIFWRGALAGFDEPTPLPYDGTGGAGESWTYGREMGWIPSEEAEALTALARRHQLTLNTLVQGAWGTLLSRATGRGDVVFGSVVSGRPAEVDGIESVVGFFINVLPVRVRVNDEPVMAALTDLQQRQIEQRDFEYCPLERIQSWSELSRGSRLIESLLVFQNFPLDPVEVTSSPGLQMLDSQVRGATHYPITLYAAPRDGGLDLRLDYHVSRLDAQAARQLLSHLRTILAAFVARPDARLAELPLITEEERHGLQTLAMGPASAAVDRCVHALVEEQAARTPDAPAVEAGGRILTYRELVESAELLARRLRRLGVKPESVVGLCVERTPGMVVGMLGVLKAGGVYLPLDPVYPRERLAFMLEDSGARVLLTQKSLMDSLPTQGQEVVLLDTVADAEPVVMGLEPVPANGAYIIYTSGSTGRPKGVLVPHSSLVNYVRSAGEEGEVGAGDRVLQFASMSFDTSAEEIYPCLTRGATLVLRDDAMAGSPESFLREVDRLGITILDLPTAYWHELVAEMESQDLGWPSRVRLVILGGEQAQALRLDTWREQVGERSRLLNTYGPTEATIVTTRRDLNGPRDFPSQVPIGRPVPGAFAHVVSPDLEPLPPILDGELVIGGAGVARGYLGRPDLTAERFVPDPFASSPGARLYRTGDLARWLRAGELEFRGRADHQVKVRGFRIELGEIEAALRRLVGVRDAAAVVREDAPGDRRIIAYVVPIGEPAPALTDLRDGLKESLPDYMIPSAFVTLPALPLTPSGKVDRRALPAPGAERPDMDSDFAAPRNPVEEMLAGIFSEVLKIERVGIHDDFFVLGGHSLLVAQVATRVRQALAIELPIPEIFRRPTVSQLAELVEKGGAAADLPDLPPVRRAPRDGRPIPLSFPQERVWFLDQLTPGGNIAYNFQVTLYFHGPLQVGILEQALTELVRRHEILRTSFPAVDGRPVQVIHSPQPVRLPLVDLREVPEEEREDVAEGIVAETLAVPFDVSRLPLIRWRLLRLDDDLHILVQVEHHFIHDGWSYAVLLREVKALYSAFLRGEPSPLPELPVQYADFATWQRDWMEGEAMERLLAFWKSKLAAHPAPTEIATDRPRPKRATFRGDVQMFGIPSDLYVGLRQFSRRQGVTLYMTMLAGFFSVLNRYTGNEDLLIGTSNANRRAREIEGMIGMVVNTLVLRGDLAGRPSFREIIGRVRELTLEVYAHQDMPFERLVQELRPERQLGRNPLFQIMYNFHDAAVPDLEFGGLRVVRRVRGNRSAKVDLNVIVVPRGEQRVGMEEREEDRHAVLHWEYNTDLFELSTMERLVGHFMNLLAGAARDPNKKLSELPLLSEDETVQLLQEWGGTGPVLGRQELSLHQLFQAQVERDPGAVALVCGSERISYGELNRRANRLARRLRALGVGPETPVPLCVDRSPDIVVGILGILKAGGGYVPIDPSYPAERIEWILEDSQARVASPLLVTQTDLTASLPESNAHILCLDAPGLEAESDADPEGGAGPGNLAYIIYTSGSTGRPKGVPISHANVVRLFSATDAWFGFGPEDVWTLFHSFAFDFSVWELWGALLHGGRLVVVPYLVSRSPEAFYLELVRERVTVLNQTPSAFRQLIAAEEAVRNRGEVEEDFALRYVVFGGEALELGSLLPWFERHGEDRPRLVNMYGITETTVHVTYRPVTLADAEAEGLGSRIGRPIPDLSVHLLDASLNLVPVGVPGEIHVGGDGLSSGYLNRPELTAERFIPDAFAGRPGARLYRSGDLARVRPGGDLEYLGRRDHQVKIRGFRIELGEIEAALTRHPAVREAIVLTRADGGGEAQLVAYLVAPPEEAPAARDLRQFLMATLPEYMIPSAFVVLDALPLTVHGKVDRKALPAPEAPRSEEETFVAPRTPVEERLAAIWSEVLGLELVGVRDDFFLLGGHSLSAARILSRVRDILGVKLSLVIVFETPTIEGMAAAVSAAVPAEFEDPILVRTVELSDGDLDALLFEMMDGETR